MSQNTEPVYSGSDEMRLYALASLFLGEFPFLRGSERDAMLGGEGEVDVIVRLEYPVGPGYVSHSYYMTRSYIGAKFRRWISKNRHTV
jgi:hypothetical protein